MEKTQKTLKIDLDTVNPDEGLLFEANKPFDFFFAEEDGVKGVSQVEVRLSLTKSGDEVFAAGTAGGTILLQCSRCLADFEFCAEAPVEAPFFPKHEESADAEEEGREPVEKDEGDINYYTGKTLDLFSVIRDQLYLSIPFKPLCREDCKGLCPTCGVDRNVTVCGCQIGKKDPRLAALEKLKDRL